MVLSSSGTLYMEMNRAITACGAAPDCDPFGFVADSLVKFASVYTSSIVTNDTVSIFESSVSFEVQRLMSDDRLRCEALDVEVAPLVRESGRIVVVKKDPSGTAQVNPPVELFVSWFVGLSVAKSLHFIPVLVEVLCFFPQIWFHEVASDRLIVLVRSKEDIRDPHEPASLSAKSADCPFGLLRTEDPAVVAEPVSRRDGLVNRSAIAVLVGHSSA